MERKWLALLRVFHDMSQREISKIVGVSPQTYSLIENGGQNISVPQAKRIAEVLGFDWTWFYREEIKLNLIIGIDRNETSFNVKEVKEQEVPK